MQNADDLLIEMDNKTDKLTRKCYFVEGFLPEKLLNFPKKRNIVFTKAINSQLNKLKGFEICLLSNVESVLGYSFDIIFNIVRHENGHPKKDN